jgi:RNA polymerase sigma-70 factor, ECF subfamily
MSMMTTSVATTVLPEVTDDVLVARIVGGDVALFEILMRRYNQRVYRAVRAILGGDEDAEDVMQEAYLSAYTHLHQFAGRAQFSTWLTRIAVNAAIARRSVRAKGRGEDSAMITLVPTIAPDPEQETLTSELRDVLQREVAALPDAFRTVLVMRDVEGLSTAETAACLEVSEDLVKTRLHRARTLLRDRLYERAGVSLASLFAFGNARCDRVVNAVMQKI